MGFFRGCTGKHKQIALTDSSAIDFKIFNVLEFTIKVNSIPLPCEQRPFDLPTYLGRSKGLDHLFVYSSHLRGEPTLAHETVD